MVAQLKGLLGKTSRPVIVCGKLLTEDRTPVVVSLENYRVIFKNPRQDTILSSDYGNSLLEKSVQNFEKEFGGIMQGYTKNKEGEEQVEIMACVDPFIGAVIVETQTYKELINPRLHSPETQLSAKQAAIVKKFAIQQWHNYYELFFNFFNRRIVAQHMPIMVKCHMTQGLFQPLIVETKNIPSPLRYGENAWLYNQLRAEEVWLEHIEDGIHKLNFSCVAMCDVGGAMSVLTVTELDRREFMLMLGIAGLCRMDVAQGNVLMKRYGRFSRRWRRGYKATPLADALIGLASGNEIRIGVAKE